MRVFFICMMLVCPMLYANNEKIIGISFGKCIGKICVHNNDSYYDSFFYQNKEKVIIYNDGLIEMTLIKSSHSLICLNEKEQKVDTKQCTDKILTIDNWFQKQNVLKEKLEMEK